MDEESEFVAASQSTTSTVASKKRKKTRKRDKTESLKGDEEDSEFETYEEYVTWRSKEEADAAMAAAADGDGASTTVVGAGFLAKLAQLREIIALLNPKPDKKKKKDKKDTMSKAGKQDGENDTAELELDKTRLIQELQDEIEQETFNTEQKIKLEEQQMQLRRVQLEKTWRKVSERRKAFMDYTLSCLEDEDWLRYMSCDGLPDPAALPELNAFLFLWSLEDARASMKTLPRQCEVVIYLIRKLDEIIQFSMKAVPSYIQDCKQIRQKFRDKLQLWVDMASYCLLRQIDRDLERLDLKNARYVQQLTPLVSCFWALIRMPISIKQVAEKDKKSVEVDFEEVGLTIKMPLDLDCYCTAIRVLWLGYDHYSDLSHTSVQPRVPDKLRMDMDLLEFCQREHEKLGELRESQREGRQQRLEEKRAMIERILNPPVVVEKKHDRKGKKGHSKGKSDAEAEHKMAPLPQLESPEEIIFREECEVMKETWKALGTLCSKKKKEINLRKYTMLGGLYRIDLIHQPPQPKDMRRDIFLTTLQLPKELEFVEFSRPYKAPPPAPENERTPEVIEAEMKALEAAMEKLALVTLKLPESVMWFEPPLVAHWLPDEGIWSTEDIHDIKYNEEKQTITFRTGRLGIHGLAGCRFINLPFQSWELKPESAKSGGGGGVLLTISGAIIQLEFLIREDLVCLHSVVGGAPALKALCHNFMTLHVLILTLRAAGCDVFPDEDSIHHVKSVRKHPVVSKHLEACMGLLSTAYVFAWSRWNHQRASREIAVQIKEVHGCIAKERSNAILLVTPFRTMVVNCSEVSSEYSGEPAEEHGKFYADVYHYALHNAGIKSRLAMKNVSYKLSTTVTNLVQATNVINMSS